MKRIFLLAAFFISTVAVKAQIVQLLFEDFNGGFPIGWQRINVDGFTPHASVSFVNDAWVVAEAFDSTGVGDSILVGTSYYSPAGTANDWLILPPVTLKNNGNFLEWQVKSQDPSFPDGYQVLINTSAAVKDSFSLLNPLFYTDAELPTWTTRSIELDSFAGQTVYLAFRLKTADKFLLLLDDIHIYADTLLSISEFDSKIELGKIFPNPADEFFNVDYFYAQPAVYALYDISGRELLKINLQKGINRILRNNFPAGVYLSTIKSELGVQNISLILR
jgi:hypothetical protein